jgi:hypothetical protein
LREAAPETLTAAQEKAQRAFDKERQFAVSLKGSPLGAGRASVLRLEEESRTGKRFGATHSIEAYPLRRLCDSIFDNKVERASREMEAWLQVKRSHKLKLRELPPVSAGLVRGECCLFFPSRQRSGFKREFDPGSESTLAACLTHASRTRKRGQPREYSGARVSNT